MAQIRLDLISNHIQHQWAGIRYCQAQAQTIAIKLHPCPCQATIGQFSQWSRQAVFKLNALFKTGNDD